MAKAAARALRALRGAGDVSVARYVWAGTGGGNDSRGSGDGHRSNDGCATTVISRRLLPPSVQSHATRAPVVRPRGSTKKLRVLGGTRRRAACGECSRRLDECCEFEAQTWRRARLGGRRAGFANKPERLLLGPSLSSPRFLLVRPTRLSCRHQPHKHIEGWLVFCAPTPLAS